MNAYFKLFDFANVTLKEFEIHGLFAPMKRSGRLYFHRRDGADDLFVVVVFFSGRCAGGIGGKRAKVLDAFHLMESHFRHGRSAGFLAKNIHGMSSDDAPID